MATLFSILGRLVLVLGLAAIGMALLAPLGYRMGWFDLGMALGSLTRWALYAAFAAVAFGLFTILALLIRKPKTGLIPALIGLVLAGGYLGFILPQLATGRSVPPIHDITTDTDNPPPFVDAVALRKAAQASNPPDYQGEEIAAQQRDAYPDIEPLYFDASADVVFDRALAVAEGLGWNIVAAEKAEGRIEASETSLFFAFTDDVVIRIREEDGRTRLDIRSKSRVGMSDIGVNAKRIRAFRDAMQAG